MRKKIVTGIEITVAIIFLSFPVLAAHYKRNDTTEMILFQKKELNIGAVYYASPERMEIRTPSSFDYEELMAASAKFRWVNNNWNFVPNRQEQWKYLLEAGPFWGNGTLIDSSSVKIIDADHKLTGLQGKATGYYSGRFYYDSRNFTLVSLNAWSRFDWYRQDAEGTLIDSNRVSSFYEDSSGRSKFRIGFEAKAGWGMGKLNNLNHLVTATGLLEEFYPARVFSEEEIRKLKMEIARIKHRRKTKAGYNAEQELKELKDYLRWGMLLELPDAIQNYWEQTEFMPRYNGTRFEFGPFFNYFNGEPDFVYGGYIQFENEKYYNLKWNRNFSSGLSYNSYKKHDWLLLETVLGWSYYHSLKTEFSFGLKYMPGLDVKDLQDMKHVHHNFIPFIVYFTQINSRLRFEADLALRIAPVDRFMMPGAEFSVSLYRSSY